MANLNDKGNSISVARLPKRKSKICCHISHAKGGQKTTIAYDLESLRKLAVDAALAYDHAVRGGCKECDRAAVQVIDESYKAGAGTHILFYNIGGESNGEA